MKQKKIDIRWLFAAAALCACAALLLFCWHSLRQGGPALPRHTVLCVLSGVLLAAAVTLLILLLLTLRSKRAEVAKREQMFSIFSADSNTVLAMMDCQAKHLLYITPNVERLLGVKEADVRQNPALLGRGAKEPEKWHDLAYLQALTPGQLHRYEVQLFHPESAAFRLYRITVIRPKPPEDDICVIAIGDLSEEQAIRQQITDALTMAENASQAKTMFLSNMSHDIRTPMNAIVGLTDLMAHNLDDPEKLSDYLGKIRDSSRHLLGILNDILDMSKIDSGTATLNLTSVSLADQLRQVETIIRPQAKARNHTFTIQAINVRHENILADGTRLGQILLNLLSNAVKYTPEGGDIRLTLKELPRRSQNYARYSFTVSDNGLGMSRDFLEHVFEPFTREESSETNAVQGTGLGLAITKNLVEMMGGSIHVDSELNRGSQFEVIIEFKVDQAADEAIAPLRVLLMGCGPELSANILTAAAHRPVTVRRAVGLAHALAFLNKEPADVILTPLPERRGVMGNNIYQLHDTQREPCPLVFFLTDRPREDVQYLAAEAHADGIVPLPFFFSNLVAEIARAEEENAKPLPGNGSKLAGMHFLCAEDNALNAEILHDLLETAGATCTICSDGRKAVKAFNASGPKEYDAILMDVQMPRMNGYEATQAIRSGKHPAAKTIPIIAMTANAFADDVRTSFRYGMTAHISKPVDLPLLETKLLRYCTPVAHRPPDHIIDIPMPPRP